MSEDTNTVQIHKKQKGDERRSLHVRITEWHHSKLNMLARETHWNKNEIVEKLIEQSAVGEHSE